MKSILQLLRFPIGGANADARLLQLARVLGFLAGGFVFVAGLLKVSRQDLTEAQLFSAVQQVVQTALLFCLFGLLLPAKSSAG